MPVVDEMNNLMVTGKGDNAAKEGKDALVTIRVNCYYLLPLLIN